MQQSTPLYFGACRVTRKHFSSLGRFVTHRLYRDIRGPSFREASTGRFPLRAKLFLWLFLIGPLAMLLPIASAQAAAAKRRLPLVTVWEGSLQDQRLVERLRGQVSDLAVEMVTAGRSGPPQASSPDSPAFARVWFTREEPLLDWVWVYVTAEGRVPKREVMRKIGSGKPTPDGELTSATLEAAALVVREVLRNLLAEGLAEPKKPAAKRVHSVRPARELRAPPEPADHEFIRLSSEVVVETVFDGAAVFRRAGLGLRLGVTYEQFELSALGALSFPVKESDPFGETRLGRYVLGLKAGRGFQPWDSIAVDLNIVAALVFYARSTDSLDPAVLGSADRVTRAALFGPELRLGWAPGGGPFELGVFGAIGFVPAAPEIGYEVDSRFEPTFSISPIQPSFGLSAKFRVGRVP